MREISAKSGLVISTGGGVVTRKENYALLRQNSNRVLIDRPLDLLSSKGRPLSKSKGVKALYEERWRLYQEFADIVIKNDGYRAGFVAGEIIRRVKGDAKC